MLAIGDSRIAELRWTRDGWCEVRARDKEEPERVGAMSDRPNGIAAFSHDLDRDGKVDVLVVDEQRAHATLSGGQALKLESADDGIMQDLSAKLLLYPGWLGPQRCAFAVRWQWDHDGGGRESASWSEETVLLGQNSGGLYRTLLSEEWGGYESWEDGTRRESTSRHLVMLRLGNNSILLKHTYAYTLNEDERSGYQSVQWFYVGDGRRLDVGRNYKRWKLPKARLERMYNEAKSDDD